VVCLSIGRSVTMLSHAKTAEPIEMPFAVWTRVGQRNHVSDGGPDPLCEWEILRGALSAPQMESETWGNAGPSAFQL